jgi:SAM-dependent methyltransferase
MDTDLKYSSTRDMDEISNLRERYARRRKRGVDTVHGRFFHYNFLAEAERDLRFAEIVRARFDDLGQRKVLEIGAGNGSNLLLFRKLGVPWAGLFANELLEECEESLCDNLPGATVLLGDAAELPYRAHFDVIVQCTVFTSILDDAFKQKLASRLLDMLTPDGLVLWYDFKYDNPGNADVKGIGKKEIRRLFARASSIEFHATTLAPPIGRRIERAYGLVNTVAPFLRTHLVAAIGAERR